MRRTSLGSLSATLAVFIVTFASFANANNCIQCPPFFGAGAIKSGLYTFWPFCIYADSIGGADRKIQFDLYGGFAWGYNIDNAIVLENATPNLDASKGPVIVCNNANTCDLTVNVLTPCGCLPQCGIGYERLSEGSVTDCPCKPACHTHIYDFSDKCGCQERCGENETRGSDCLCKCDPVSFTKSAQCGCQPLCGTDMIRNDQTCQCEPGCKDKSKILIEGCGCQPLDKCPFSTDYNEFCLCGRDCPEEYVFDEELHRCKFPVCNPGSERDFDGISCVPICDLSVRQNSQQCGCIPKCGTGNELNLSNCQCYPVITEKQRCETNREALDIFCGPVDDYATYAGAYCPMSLLTVPTNPAEAKKYYETLTGYMDKAAKFIETFKTPKDPESEMGQRQTRALIEIKSLVTVGAAIVGGSGAAIFGPEAAAAYIFWCKANSVVAKIGDGCKKLKDVFLNCESIPNRQRRSLTFDFEEFDVTPSPSVTLELPDQDSPINFMPSTQFLGNRRRLSRRSETNPCSDLVAFWTEFDCTNIPPEIDCTQIIVPSTVPANDLADLQTQCEELNTDTEGLRTMCALRDGFIAFEPYCDSSLWDTISATQGADRRRYNARFDTWA